SPWLRRVRMGSGIRDGACRACDDWATDGGESRSRAGSRTAGFVEAASRHFLSRALSESPAYSQRSRDGQVPVRRYLSASSVIEQGFTLSPMRDETGCRLVECAGRPGLGERLHYTGGGRAGLTITDHATRRGPGR